MIQKQVESRLYYGIFANVQKARVAVAAIGSSPDLMGFIHVCVYVYV